MARLRSEAWLSVQRLSGVSAPRKLTGELDQGSDVIKMILNEAGQEQQVVLVHGKLHQTKAQVQPLHVATFGQLNQQRATM